MMIEERELAIFGSFGFGNLGDELVPECFRKLLSAAGVNKPVQAISRFEGITIGDSKSFPNLKDNSEIKNLDTIVLAGGGIIEPRDMSCINRAFKIQAQSSRIRVVTHAISVEPGVRFSWGQRRKLNHQLRQIETSSVRDVISEQVLKRLAPHHPTQVIGDIALWIEPEQLPLFLEKRLPKRSIALVLSDNWDTPDFIDWLATDLAILARQMAATILLVPFSGAYGEDFKIYAKIVNKLNQIDPRVEVISALDYFDFSEMSPGRAAALLRRADLTISMRLHGCVVSYAVGTPFLALAYHPKLRGFVETVGHNSALIPNNLPNHQSSRTYGYKFADLNLRRGMLVDRAGLVIPEIDFSATAYFKRLQICSIRKILNYDIQII